MNEHSATRVPFGLWVYIMSDCVLFASLFAAYAVLHTATAGGPLAVALFDKRYVLAETLVLLTSSFSCGLAVLAGYRKNALGVWLGLLATLALGLAFVGMEVSEFGHLIAAGHGPTTSAFLSSFFTLVATHGLHVLVGCIWILAMLAYLLARGLTDVSARRIMYFSLFWHFLDIVWICIFSFVYLFGFLSL